MQYIARFISGLTSRTVWTVIVLVVINGVPSVRDYFSADWLPWIDTGLGLLAWHFRVNPKANLAP